MNIHDKVKLVFQWNQTPNQALLNKENLEILGHVISYASAFPTAYKTVSRSNFETSIKKINSEIQNTNKKLTKLLGDYSGKLNEENKLSIVEELKQHEKNAENDYEKDIIRGFWQKLRF